MKFRPLFYEVLKKKKTFVVYSFTVYRSCGQLEFMSVTMVSSGDNFHSWEQKYVYKNASKHSCSIINISVVFSKEFLKYRQIHCFYFNSEVQRMQKLKVGNRSLSIRQDTSKFEKVTSNSTSLHSGMSFELLIQCCSDTYIYLNVNEMYLAGYTTAVATKSDTLSYLIQIPQVLF